MLVKGLEVKGGGVFFRASRIIRSTGGGSADGHGSLENNRLMGYAHIGCQKVTLKYLYLYFHERVFLQQ